MSSTPDVVFALLILLPALLLMGLAVRSLFRRPPASPAQDEPPPLTFESKPQDDAPRCLCGEVATDPSPALERGRGSVLRDLFALPPRYRHVIRAGGPLVYCRAHAHVADARLAEFVATRIRAVYTRAYAEVAIEAAAFETETLPRLVLDSLTEEQRRKVRRAPVPRAGRLELIAGSTSVPPEAFGATREP